jgi:2',3'-cyclic-nucleotide 2'-phosphodiesterase/3'-nucleotidase
MRHMKILPVLIVAALLAASCSVQDEHIHIYATTDLHGMLLPYDFTEGTARDRSLANLDSMITAGGRENLILLDNGDILQGDPLVYYYNYVDTTRTHIVADILNYTGYDAATAGNHDIEAGHSVYDRVRREYSFPLLAANAVKEGTGEPYFEPYTIIKKAGRKVLIFGLITPSVPEWLPVSLYEGIRFDDMVETARKWMPAMKSEKPDVIVGLFHSGMGDEDETGGDENSSIAVAVNVPGFDVIFCGHDHRQDMCQVVNDAGDTVLIIDGGSRADVLMHADIQFNEKDSGKGSLSISGNLIPMNSMPASTLFIQKYQGVIDTIKSYTSEVIGIFKAPATTRDAFFGPSAFVDLIHRIQLDITGAEVSLAAPLSFDQQINKGEICVRDMFRLYRYENFLYKIKMTGREIDRHLEHSYGMWFATMHNKNDYLLNYRMDDNNKPLIVNGSVRLRNNSYNFDSAMGIKYTVDVSKPAGDRVSISAMSDGSAFYNDSLYTVAVNSYRANGGGGHFPAAGITHEILKTRTMSTTDRDLRYYMTEWIKERGEVTPMPLSTWKVIPESWAEQAAKRELILLFPEHDL